MMGRTHALTGVLAGLLTGPLIGLTTVEQLGPYAATMAGFALLPDLDHPQSTATRKLGWLTRGLSWALRGASAWLYARTKGPRDEQVSGQHRHLTHTLVFALALGGACVVSTAAWGPWAVAAWLAVGLLLAVDRLGRLVLASFGIGLVTWLPAVLADPATFGQAALGALDASAGWLGVAVAGGCLVHDLGDSLTESGCPFLWPFLPIKGETWYEIRPPKWLRFRTGTRFETWVVFPLVLAGCLLAIPGLPGHVADLFVPPAGVGANVP